jgi:hypothetical protein
MITIARILLLLIVGLFVGLLIVSTCRSCESKKPIFAKIRSVQVPESICEAKENEVSLKNEYYVEN